MIASKILDIIALIHKIAPMRLSDVKVGDSLLGFYSLQKCELLPFSGGVRLELVFGDQSGKLIGILWGEDAEAAYPELKDAEVVKVKGLLGSYRGTPQLQIDKIRPAQTDEYDLADLLPTSDIPIDQLESETTALIDSISDDTIRLLVSELIFDPEIKPLFFQVPGGITWHHPYLGGLAEHSLSMAQLAAVVSDHYQQLNRSLMVAGALLHDLGKIIELEVGSSFKYSTPGRLYGHIVMGYEIVKKKAVELEIENDPAVCKLLHMILSHQGKKEFSVPVEPKFEEAFVLYFIDEMDSKLNAIAQIRKKPENEGLEFSKYIRLLETQLYLARDEDKVDSKDNE